MPSDSKTVPLSQLGDDESPTTVLVIHRGQVREIPLDDGGELVIGRGKDATVQVADRGLSRQHVRIRVDGDVATVTDLGSSNGTFLRGVRLEPHSAQRLAFDLPVSVGETRVVVQGAGRSRSVGPYATAVETTRRMAASLLNVLFVGESGTGKTYLARALHRHSPRASAALVEFDLRAQPFDPRVVHPGQTLLLRELDVMRPIQQHRLSSQLASTKNVRLLGSLRATAADSMQPSLRRILGEVEIVIPPPHEMGEELAGIAQALVAESAQRMQLSHTPQLTEEALQQISRHRYRDGIRELRAAIDRAVGHCTTPTIGAEEILFGGTQDEWTPEERRELERIMAALDECAGNQSRAAKMLGVSRGTFVARLDKYGLRRPRK